MSFVTSAAPPCEILTQRLESYIMLADAEKFGRVDIAKLS